MENNIMGYVLIFISIIIYFIVELYGIRVDKEIKKLKGEKMEIKIFNDVIDGWKTIVVEKEIAIVNGEKNCMLKMMEKRDIN